MNHHITNANIKDWAKNYDGELFDGILCDPPYHLVSGKTSEEIGHPSWNSKTKTTRSAKKKGFMGKDWDGVDENGIGIAQDPEMWRLLYNLLKPGGHLLAFSGSRTYHRMAVAIEDAGFEIRDQLIWMYGSGFPKSLNIGKAVDRLQGNERESVGKYEIGGMTPDRENFGANDRSGGKGMGFRPGEIEITKGTSEWEGYGTALKPAHEPCVLARKPLDGTVANNVLKHGTGGLNIDGTRIKGESWGKRTNGSPEGKVYELGIKGGTQQESNSLGRFPANLIHDGSDEVEAVFPQTKGSSAPRTNKSGTNIAYGTYSKVTTQNGTWGDSGSASRYFYTAKASKSERNAGLEGFDKKEAPKFSGGDETREGKPSLRPMFQNFHPTVKPLSLTKYLATLIKPPTGGRLLVPFSGSGSEMIGALQAGWEYVEGVELTEDYIPIAEARIKHWLEQKAEEDNKPKQESLL